MSYDVILVPRRDGQSWKHALDEVELRADSDEPLDDRRLAQWTAIERRLLERASEIDVFADASVVEASFTVGLQVSLFADEACVSYPYWEQEDPDAFRALVVDAVRIVEEETGFEAWDPQTGQAFDGTLDDETGLAAVRKMNAEGGEPGRFDVDGEPAVGGTVILRVRGSRVRRSSLQLFSQWSSRAHGDVTGPRPAGGRVSRMTIAVTGWYRFKHLLRGHPTSPCWICHRTTRVPIL